MVTLPEMLGFDSTPVNQVSAISNGQLTKGINWKNSVKPEMYRDVSLYGKHEDGEDRCE